MKHLPWSTIVALAAISIGSTSLHAQRQLSDDGLVSMIIPDGWQAMELNEEASLQFGNETAAAYVIVLNESKQDLYGWNITRHSVVTLARLVSSLDFPEITGPTALGLSGANAVQYRIEGVSQGTRITYLHTTIDGPEAFTQIVAWTTPSHWDDNELKLQATIESIAFGSEPARTGKQ